MGRWFWWALAGLGALALTAGGKAQAAAEKLGNLVVTITLKPGTANIVAVNQALNALLAARSTACPTFPDVRSAVGTPGVSGNDIVATYVAAWTHDKLGAIKEDVRACALRYLQGLNPNITNLKAERVS